MEKEKNLNKGKVARVSCDTDRIRRSGIFNKGKSGVEIIREGRDKRIF